MIRIGTESESEIAEAYVPQRVTGFLKRGGLLGLEYPPARDAGILPEAGEGP